MRSSDPLTAQSVAEFLRSLGSGAPTPGGGAAAALCGSMAAALVAMVGRVTAARESSAERQASAIVAQADDLGDRLARLATEDMEAYERMIEARRSRGEPADLARALARATEVPIQAVRASREVLALCETLAPLARRTALSDLAVAASLAWSAIESGALTARTNLAEAQAPEVARTSERELSGLLASGQDARGRLSATMAARANRGQPS
jgi:formiminotetrahydrofolate cyclodeaminase